MKEKLWGIGTLEIDLFHTISQGKKRREKNGAKGWQIKPGVKWTDCNLPSIPEGLAQAGSLLVYYKYFLKGPVISSRFWLQKQETPRPHSSLRLSEPKTLFNPLRKWRKTFRDRSPRLVFDYKNRRLLDPYSIPYVRHAGVVLWGHRNIKCPGKTCAFYISVPPEGIEPSTVCLKGSCSTDWAIGTYFIFFKHKKILQYTNIKYNTFPVWEENYTLLGFPPQINREKPATLIIWIKKFFIILLLLLLLEHSQKQSRSSVYILNQRKIQLQQQSANMTPIHAVTEH